MCFNLGSLWNWAKGTGLFANPLLGGKSQDSRDEGKDGGREKWGRINRREDALRPAMDSNKCSWLLFSLSTQLGGNRNIDLLAPIPISQTCPFDFNPCSPLPQLLGGSTWPFQSPPKKPDLITEAWCPDEWQKPADSYVWMSAGRISGPAWEPAGTYGCWVDPRASCISVNRESLGQEAKDK